MRRTKEKLVRVTLTFNILMALVLSACTGDTVKPADEPTDGMDNNPTTLVEGEIQPTAEHPGGVERAPENSNVEVEDVEAQVLSTQDIIDLAAEEGITLTPEAATELEKILKANPDKRMVYRMDPDTNSAQVITKSDSENNTSTMEFFKISNVSFIQTDGSDINFTNSDGTILATVTITPTRASITLTPESFAAPTPVVPMETAEPETPEAPLIPIENTDSKIELIPGNKIIEILQETNQLELKIAVNLLTDIQNPVVVSVLQTDGSYKVERVTLDNSNFYITDQGRITAKTEYTEIDINGEAVSVESTWLPQIGDWASKQRSFDNSDLLTVWVANSSLRSEGISTPALNVSPSNLYSITPITGQELLSLIESKSDTVVSVENMAALEEIFEAKGFVLPTSFPLFNNQTINSDSINAIEVAENEYYIFFTTLINKEAPTSAQIEAVIAYHKGMATASQIKILENMSDNFINGEPLQAIIETASGPEVVKLNGIEVIFNHSETQGRPLDTAAAESLINIPAYPIEKNPNGGLTVLYTNINHNNAGYTSSRQLTEELGKYGYEVKFDAYLDLSTIMFEETDGTIYIYRGGSLPHTE